MTHEDLVDLIHTRTSAELSKRQVKDVLAALAEEIRLEVARGHETTLNGLCKFGVVDKAARTGRNPSTGEAIEIPAHRAVKIKPLKALRDVVEA
jgi:DNA-binding protein HU-beta